MLIRTAEKHFKTTNQKLLSFLYCKDILLSGVEVCGFTQFLSDGLATLK